MISKVTNKLLDYVSTGKASVDFRNSSVGHYKMTFIGGKSIKLYLGDNSIKISDIQCDYDNDCFKTGCDIIISIKDFLSSDTSLILDNVLSEFVFANQLRLPGIREIVPSLRAGKYYNAIDDFRIDFLSNLGPCGWTQRELCISVFSRYVSVRLDCSSNISTIYSKVYMKDFIEENIDSNIKVSIDSFDRRCCKLVVTCSSTTPINDINNGILGVDIPDIINFLGSIKKIRLD